MCIKNKGNKKNKRTLVTLYLIDKIFLNIIEDFYYENKKYYYQFKSSKFHRFIKQDNSSQTSLHFNTFDENYYVYLNREVAEKDLVMLEEQYKKTFLKNNRANIIVKVLEKIIIEKFGEKYFNEKFEEETEKWAKEYEDKMKKISQKSKPIYLKSRKGE